MMMVMEVDYDYDDREIMMAKINACDSNYITKESKTLVFDQQNETNRSETSNHFGSSSGKKKEINAV